MVSTLLLSQNMMTLVYALSQICDFHIPSILSQVQVSVLVPLHRDTHHTTLRMVHSISTGRCQLRNLLAQPLYVSHVDDEKSDENLSVVAVVHDIQDGLLREMG